MLWAISPPWGPSPACVAPVTLMVGSAAETEGDRQADQGDYAGQ
jgi:hypothetical protein